jgi:hypothetical protein
LLKAAQEMALKVRLFDEDGHHPEKLHLKSSNDHMLFQRSILINFDLKL